ncbi:MAG: flagellar biosynthetic protein FliO [Candidatus Endonucleobacter sp. (ex Gigantidas childressi)]|nr:flagellar biosynthetic protein FliO [Candidatus Endonucleobacter sp. (ex Gigantidas childressi)]
MKELILLASFALPVYAEETKTLSEMNIWQMIAPLIIIIVLIFLLAWWVKKISPGQALTSKGITILSCTSISGQARLCLVRVGNKDILVGVTNQQITRIETFNEPVIEKETEPATTELSKIFRHILKHRKGS